MNSSLIKLRDLLEEKVVADEEDLIGQLEDDFCELTGTISDLEDQVNDLENETTPDCDSCDKLEATEGFVDPVLLHSDLLQLEASYTLKQISEETYLYCKNVLNKYVTI